MRIKSNGNVGIGLTDPGKPLDVNGEIRGTAFIGRSNISTPTEDTSIFRVADNTLAFGTAQTERMRIDSSGRVMVGTTSPEAVLTLNNTGQTTQTLLHLEDTGGSGAHSHIAFKNTTGDVASILTVSDNLQFRVDDATVFANLSATENARITSNGILRIGCTAQPSTTVPGAQFDAGGKTLRVSVGEGTSGTTAAGISLIGGGSSTNIAASASY